MVDLPDLKENEKKLRYWADRLRILVPFIGTFVGGAGTAVAIALHVKADVLHHVLDLPSSFHLLDSVTLWLVLSISSCLLSLLVAGKTLLTKERLKRAATAVVRERRRVDQWLGMAADDEGLDIDSVFVVGLVLTVAGPALTVEMMVDNRHPDPIKIAGVRLNWVQGDGAPLLPNALTVLSSESELFKGPRQVAGSFELTREIADRKTPTSAHISFDFTRYGVRWQRWSKGVQAIVTA